MGFLLAAPLAAAGDTDTSLLECRGIVDGAERLSCYDAVVDRARAELAASTTTDVSPPPAAASEEGKTDATLGERSFGRPSDERSRTLQRAFGVAAPNEITSKAVVVRLTGSRLFEVTLENGQTWRQEENRSFALKPGDTIEIEAGALGAYYLRRNQKGRTVRVERVR